MSTLKITSLTQSLMAVKITQDKTKKTSQDKTKKISQDKTQARKETLLTCCPPLPLMQVRLFEPLLGAEDSLIVERIRAVIGVPSYFKARTL